MKIHRLGSFHSRRGRLLAALVAASALAGTGCSGSMSAEGATPDGFTEHRGAGYRFALPSDWSNSGPADLTQPHLGPDLIFHGPPALLCTAMADAEENYAGDLSRHAQEQREALTALPGGGEVREETRRLPGAGEGVLIRADFVNQAGPTTAHTLAQLRQDKTLLTLTVVTPRDGGKQCRVDEILDTFRLAG